LLNVATPTLVIEQVLALPKEENSLFDTTLKSSSLFDTKQLFLPYMTLCLKFVPYMTFRLILLLADTYTHTYNIAGVIWSLR
jgi:hypothetical protein